MFIYEQTTSDLFLLSSSKAYQFPFPLAVFCASPLLRIARSLTCVFLASKTEEQITNVSHLAKATDTDDLHILGKELTLLQVNLRRTSRESSRRGLGGIERGGQGTGSGRRRVGHVCLPTST